jgi:hypothetical protein
VEEYAVGDAPVVSTERGLTAAANFNSWDLPQPGSPTYGNMRGPKVNKSQT